MFMKFVAVDELLTAGQTLLHCNMDNKKLIVYMKLYYRCGSVEQKAIDSCYR